MKNLKERAPVFLLGLMFGLIIAGGFFILKLDEYFKELSGYEKMAAGYSYNTESSAEQEKKDVSEKPVKKTKNKKSETFPSDSSSIQMNATTDVITDSAQNVTRLDSIPSQTSDDIVVKKDELLSTVTLEVFNLNPVASRSGKDSVLQKVSGVKDDRNPGKQMFNLEFWKSPLNYKGYKMSKYKIVLYGLTATDGIKIFKLDETVYLKSNLGVYKLDPVSDFRSYERITDETILSRLK